MENIILGNDPHYLLYKKSNYFLVVVFEWSIYPIMRNRTKKYGVSGRLHFEPIKSKSIFVESARASDGRWIDECASGKMLHKFISS